MTAANDPRLVGRHPEFARQSRRPGVGANAVLGIAELIEKWIGADQVVDVPHALLEGNKPLPLGRYMRKKLRLQLGLSEATPDEVLHSAWTEQVLPLLQMAKASKETISLREAFRRQNQAYADQLEFRRRTFEKGKL